MRTTSVKLTKTKLRQKIPSGKAVTRTLWCVTWPKVKDGKRTGRNRRFFASKLVNDRDEGKAAAETLLQAKLVEQRNFGTAGLAFTEHQRAEYLECMASLSKHGKTLRDAVKFYLPHLEATKKTCTAAELVTALLSHKKAFGASTRYLSDLRSRLGQFAATFNGKPIAEITSADIDQWLQSLSDSATGTPLAPITRNNFRRVLIVAFSFAMKRGYCLSNPAKEASKAKETKHAASILTLGQSADLLTHADAAILPAVALGLFAGLRPESEGLRLDWSHIDFGDKTINIEPDNTKVDSSARYVAMSPNLVAWLLPHRKQSGPVLPAIGDYYKLLQKARKAAGIEVWPHDALRHSFGSYHYGAHHNAALTQALMGHTNAQIFFRHYRKAMKKSVANKYWKIMPADTKRRGKNVVVFKAAA